MAFYQEGLDLLSTSTNRLAVSHRDTEDLRKPATLLRELGLVLAIGFLARLLFGLLTSNTYDYDEFAYLLLARDFAHGDVPYRDFMLFQPPGAIVWLRLLDPLTGLWWPSARIASTVFDTVTVGCVWQLARITSGLRLARAAGILYGLSPIALVSSVRVEQDPLMTCLAMVGLTVLVSRRSRWAAVVAGACLGAAIWVKYPAVLFLPVYVIAQPRRFLEVLVGTISAFGVLLIPFHDQLHAVYSQTVEFQRTRWTMALSQRLGTVALFWLGANLLALPGLLRATPLWVKAGFLVGGLFLFTSQVYYHYFLPVAPFAALLAAPLALRIFHRRKVLLSLAVMVLIALWAALLDFAAPSPLYVTAARLSDVRDTVSILDRATRPEEPVLADRGEYAYLANRPDLVHYYWNIGVIVSARYLEHRVPSAGAVVLSYGASSGYPHGFIRYLDAHYRSIRTSTTSVWLTHGETAARQGAGGKNGRGERI